MTGIIKGVLFSLIFGAFLATELCAQSTYTASGCSQSQVQTAITAEQVSPVDGDVIAIPTCSATWSGMITQAFNNSVTIQGAGAISATTGGAGTTGSDLTAITATGTVLINLTITGGKSLRVTGIGFLTTTNTYLPILQIGGSSTAVRVDHCHFYMGNTGGDSGLEIDGAVQGVADHNYFQCASGGAGFNPIRVYNGQTWQGASDNYGDQSWVDSDHFGTSEFFFFEDNQWYNGYVGDGEVGSRYVIRHSTITGDGTGDQTMYNHSLVSASPYRAAPRACEIYYNTFTKTSGNATGAFQENGGTVLFWGNTVTGPGYNYGININYTRTTTPGFGAPPSDWGQCGASYGGTGWDGKADSTGYPCMDQPGRGAGNLVGGSTFPTLCNETAGCPNYTGSWVHQVLDPIYAWANTLSTLAAGGGLIGNFVTSIVVDNRDFYQQFSTYGEAGSFNGTVGVGQGSGTPTTTGAYPNAPNCTAGKDLKTGTAGPGVGWWDTSNNTLYVCTATNTWTAYYSPYTYPHPLTLTLPPTNVQAVGH